MELERNCTENKKVHKDSVSYATGEWDMKRQQGNAEANMGTTGLTKT